MKKLTILQVLATTLVSASNVACEGVLGHSGESGMSSASMSGNSDIAPADDDSSFPIPGADGTDPGVCVSLNSRVRRLSLRQFDEAVKALLPDLAEPPSENILATYATNNPRYSSAADEQTMSVPHVDDLLSLMDDMSGELIQELSGWVECEPEAPECADAVVEALVTRAYRRPATEEELQRFAAFLNAQAAAFGAADALGMLVQVVLMSPPSLHRTEAGTGPGTELTQHEIAALISYTVTDSAPDEELQEAAGAGLLAEPEERRAHAERLLANPESARGLLKFMNEYSHADNIFTASLDVELFPEFTPELRQRFYEEYERFVRHVLWEDEGTFRNLVTAPYTFVDAALAEHYELPPVSGDDWQMMPTHDRMGILSQGVSLAQISNADNNGTSIVRRGVLMRDEVLCLPHLAPPPEVDDQLPVTLDGPSTQRERLAAHATGSCAGCHSYIDPFGFPFEAFDALGRVRSEEQGLPIDTSAELPIDGETFEVDGYPELVERISESGEAAACFSRHVQLFVDGTRRSAACLPSDTEEPIRERLVEWIGSEDFITRGAL